MGRKRYKVSFEKHIDDVIIYLKVLSLSKTTQRMPLSLIDWKSSSSILLTEIWGMIKDGLKTACIAFLMPGILILCLIEYFDRLIDPATRINERKPVENTIFPLIDEVDMNCSGYIHPSFIYATKYRIQHQQSQARVKRKSIFVRGNIVNPRYFQVNVTDVQSQSYISILMGQ